MLKEKFKQRYLDLSLINKIKLTLVSFTITPIIVLCLILIPVNKNYLNADMNGKMNKALQKVISLVDRELLNYLDKSNVIITNTSILNGLNFDYSNELSELLSFYDSISMIFEGLQSQSSNSSVNIFTVYSDNESMFVSKNINKYELLPQEVKEVFNERPNEIYWYPNVVDNEQGEKCIVLYRNYRQRLHRSVLEVKIPVNNIISYLKSAHIMEEAFVECRDKNGQILFSETFAENNIDINDKGTFSVQSPLINGFNVSVYVAKSVLSDNIRLLYLYFFIAIVLILIIILGLSNMITKKIFSELTGFIEVIDGRNEFDYINNIQIKNNDEISKIKVKFRDIIYKLESSYIQSRDLMQEKKYLEMELLQSKLNPHLLYNSLSEIKWCAVKNKDDNIIEIVNTLTNYYRLVLNKGSNVIKVDDELKLIKEYVRIIKIARHEVFTFDISVRDEILQFYILRLLLQPLVENCIMHGINGMNGNGRIMISGEMVDNDIIIKISDNGHGISKELLAKMKHDSIEIGYNGFGVSNTDKRIKLNFGAQYGIDVESTEGQGTTVTLRLAAISNKDVLEKNIE